MIFTHGRMVYMISRTPVLWHKNRKNKLIIYIVLAFGWRRILFYFYIFGDKEKIPEFLTAIFGPNLYVIIINNYWTKHNIDKMVYQLKDTSPYNKCTRF